MWCPSRFVWRVILPSQNGRRLCPWKARFSRRWGKRCCATAPLFYRRTGAGNRCRRRSRGWCATRSGIAFFHSTERRCASTRTLRRHDRSLFSHQDRQTTWEYPAWLPLQPVDRVTRPPLVQYPASSSAFRGQNNASRRRNGWTRRVIGIAVGASPCLPWPPPSQRSTAWSLHTVCTFCRHHNPGLWRQPGSSPGIHPRYQRRSQETPADIGSR